MYIVKAWTGTDSMAGQATVRDAAAAGEKVTEMLTRLPQARIEVKPFTAKSEVRSPGVPSGR